MKRYEVQQLIDLCRKAKAAVERSKWPFVGQCLSAVVVAPYDEVLDEAHRELITLICPDEAEGG